MAKIVSQVDKHDILFPLCDDMGKLVGAVSKALDTPPSAPRMLVYVVRIEFCVLGETVPLFLDEDDSAHIEMRANSGAVRQLVIDRLRSSDDFEWRNRAWDEDEGRT